MESEKEIIEWNMIRPDGSERLLHIGKNEVKSEELNISSNTNSIILFEIYFSPQYTAYLRFYGYTPLRLHLEKAGEFPKHIYIDNNQSFVYLEQLENTTIDVYDNEEFATFSFEKKIKKPEIDYDLIEKKKRIQWLNDNIEYEDLKREENEYGSKSLYSQNFFNYNKKKTQNINDKSDKEKNDSMSDLSKDKSGSLSTLKEKKDIKEESEKSEMSKISEEKIKSEKEEKSEEKYEEKEEKDEYVEKNEKKESEKNEKESEVIEDKEDKEEESNERVKEESYEEKSEKGPEDVEKSGKSLSEQGKKMEIENGSKSENDSNKKNDSEYESSKKEIKEEKMDIENDSQKDKSVSESDKESSKRESEQKNTLNYDKVLDHFVLSNEEEEEEEQEEEDENSKEKEEEKESEKNSEKEDKKLNKKNMAEQSSNLKTNQKNNKTENTDTKNKSNISTSSKCPICLDTITRPATLKPCGHQFCKGCIEEWLKKSSACPDCKKNAKKLYFYEEKLKKYMGKRVKRKKYKAEKQALEDWFVNCDKACLICGKEDNDTYLLVCDTCNFRICHTFCVGLDSIPDTEWQCPECKAKEQGKTFSLSKRN